MEDGVLYCVCHKSTYSSLPDDYNCKVELALTSDGRTIVCYHPSVDIPYEHTKPIPHPDPVHNNEDTHDQVLKTRLEVKDEPLEQGPMIEQLSKMFFTTKHRWYPHGQSETVKGNSAYEAVGNNFIHLSFHVCWWALPRSTGAFFVLKEYFQTLYSLCVL
ncbi:large ribosomal subunit protein mL42 isoform X2 [Trichechus manatus latirostris]|uniref:Large ribosomal subunit protein mL42 n=1 Tax=Trichechus manatus latirostris TaxID=127582 RepID=A0A2Y9RGC6_TRIMA|nr:large ribosomal subunit protein mL42 isoform X2 [Trichechus manatus latirostris]